MFWETKERNKFISQIDNLNLMKKNIYKHFELKKL
jgi:hypothetical protein